MPFWAGNFFWIIVEVSTICTGMRVGQMRVQIVQFVQKYAQGKIVLTKHGEQSEKKKNNPLVLPAAA